MLPLLTGIVPPLNDKVLTPLFKVMPQFDSDGSSAGGGVAEKDMFAGKGTAARAAFVKTYAVG
ncbi:MAG: hypothetical protein ACOYM3_23175, partial [Terrimicrobiaceae bacterium]